MLLAFGHKARHGKDTAGEAVAELYNNRRQSAILHGIYHPKHHPEARIFKFADELYRVCREEYGMKEKDAKLLQKVGDGRRVEFGADYWIKQLEPKLLNYLGRNLKPNEFAKPTIAIITDARYTNEADWIKSLGGHTINVRRLNQDGAPFVTDDRDPNFISEVQLDGYNYDYHIVSKSAAYTAEQAITTAEYIRALEQLN